MVKQEAKEEKMKGYAYMRVPGGAIVAINFVVAERNYTKEGRRPKSHQNVVMGTARVRQLYCLMAKETVMDVLEEGEEYNIVRVIRTPCSLN